MKLSFACMSLVALGVSFVVVDGANAADQRTYSGGRFVLSIGGAPLPFVKSIEGGDQVGDAVTDPRPTTPREGPVERAAVFPKRHLTGVHYTPITVVAPLANAPLASWIGDTLNGTGAPKAVSLSLGDFNFKEQSRFDFDRATITEIDFPALDGASKDEAYLSVVVQSDSVRHAAGSGQDIRGASIPPTQPKQLASNWKLTIPGLPTSRVAKISPIVVKRTPSGLTASNITLDVSMADLAAWQAWQDAFMTRGDNGDAFEKTGTLEYLGTDMTTVNNRLSFKGIGLARFSMGSTQANSEAIARFTVELYVEDVKLTK